MALPRELTTVTRLSKTVALILFISLPFIGFLLGMRWQGMLSQNQQVTTVVSVTSQPTPADSVVPSPDNNEILTLLPTLAPKVTWGEINRDTYTYSSVNKPLTGASRVGSIVISNDKDLPNLDFMHDTEALKKLGWEYQTDANGPGSEYWEYKKTYQGNQALLVFNSKASFSNDKQGIPSCKSPCIWKITVFVSDPF